MLNNFQAGITNRSWVYSYQSVEMHVSREKVITVAVWYTHVLYEG